MQDIDIVVNVQRIIFKSCVDEKIFIFEVTLR